MTKKRFPVVLAIATICFILYVACFTTWIVLVFVLLAQTPSSQIEGFFYALKIIDDPALQEKYYLLVLLVDFSPLFALASLITAWISLYKTKNRIFPACMLALSIPGAAWATCAIVYHITSLL